MPTPRLHRFLPLGIVLLAGCATKTDGWRTPVPGLIPVEKAVEVACPLPYTTGKNLAGRAIYPNGFVAQTRPEVAAALRSAACNLSAQGYRLVVLDAWRPAVSGAILSWASAQRGHENMAAIPEISGHTRAISADVTITDLKGAAVPMPSAYDFPATPGMETSGSRALREAMGRAGFTGHRSEWWHFDYRPLKGAPMIPGPPRFGRYEYEGGKFRAKGQTGRNPHGPDRGPRGGSSK